VRLSVLMVTNNYPTAANPHMGAATALQERGIKGLGVDVNVLFFDRLLSGRSVYKGMGDRILSAARDKKCDLVHIQFGGVPAFQTVRACGRRCVITFHGTDLHGGSPKGLVDRASFGVGVMASKWAAARSGWNIVVSPDLASRLEGLTRRVSIIPTGVDYDIFKPMPRQAALSALGLNAGKRYVVFCDSMRAAVKRRDLALAALQVANARGLNLEMIELHRVPHGNIPFYLNAAACLLLTSDKEGSPNIVKEAIACDLPVVSVDVGDVSERINGISRSRVVPRDAVLIGEALAEIILSGKRADGREIKRQEIENGPICEKVVSVYEKIMAEGLKPPWFE